MAGEQDDQVERLERELARARERLEEIERDEDEDPWGPAVLRQELQVRELERQLERAREARPAGEPGTPAAPRTRRTRRLVAGAVAGAIAVGVSLFVVAGGRAHEPAACVPAQAPATYPGPAPCGTG